MASPPPSDAEPSVRVDAAAVDDADRTTRRPLPLGWAVAASGSTSPSSSPSRPSGGAATTSPATSAACSARRHRFCSVWSWAGWWSVSSPVARTSASVRGSMSTAASTSGSATVIVGLAARRLLWDKGIALAFVIVAAVVLGVALMGLARVVDAFATDERADFPSGYAVDAAATGRARRQEEPSSICTWATCPTRPLPTSSQPCSVGSARHLRPGHHGS